MEHVKKHFKKHDHILYTAIQGDRWHTLQPSNDHFIGLCKIITGQQVSTKAAASIYAKFTSLFPRKKPTPKRILALTEEQLRSAGLSRAKALAIRDIAARFEDYSLSFKDADLKTNEEIISMLVQARGIGPWSAEMFLIFNLGREDVFSGGDYGLRMAIKKLYKKRDLPSPEKAAQLAKAWAPYRSYACLILWESLNNTPQ